MNEQENENIHYLKLMVEIQLYPIMKILGHNKDKIVQAKKEEAISNFINRLPDNLKQVPNARKIIDDTIKRVEENERRIREDEER